MTKYLFTFLMLSILFYGCSESESDTADTADTADTGDTATSYGQNARVRNPDVGWRPYVYIQ
jgi:hypothetical protein